MKDNGQGYLFIASALWAHSCFRRSVYCEAAKMKNGFQVTVLDSEALESWNLDRILI